MSFDLGHPGAGMEPYPRRSGTPAEVFAVAGLVPIGPFMRASEEQQAVCSTCGTTRWVRLSNLRRGGVACRWCHGWTRWGPWGERNRTMTATWREVRGADFSLDVLAGLHLRPLSPVGDEFLPVGVECLRCGETLVMVPERAVVERGWFGCDRCSAARTHDVLAGAADVYERAGLRLVGRCRGEHVPQTVECMRCGTMRAVSLRRVLDGSAPLCWTCTHGIRPDEPHRVYLVRFPQLHVLKVGLTHARHDARLEAHRLEGGEVLATVVVPDRATARLLEAAVLARYVPWRAVVGPWAFPQGGYTETWVDDPAAPPCDLDALVAEIVR